MASSSTTWRSWCPGSSAPATSMWRRSTAARSPAEACWSTSRSVPVKWIWEHNVLYFTYETFPCLQCLYSSCFRHTLRYTRVKSCHIQSQCCRYFSIRLLCLIVGSAACVIERAILTSVQLHKTCFELQMLHDLLKKGWLQFLTNVSERKCLKDLFFLCLFFWF